MPLPIKKYPAILLPLLWLFSSCATVLNQPWQRVDITTGKNISVVSVNKMPLTNFSFMGPDGAKTYYVERGNKKLAIDVQVDSVQKTVFLKPKNSFAFWLNFYSYGLGMLVDWNNPKRYAYRAKNYITLKDTAIYVYRFAPIKKGAINLTASLLSPTAFSINTPGRQYQSGGLLGIGAGVEYFYKNNQYLSFSGGAATDNGLNDYSYPGSIRASGVVFASVRNSHVLASFDLGYGLNLSHFIWAKTNKNDSLRILHLQNNTGLGLSLYAGYRFGYNFSMGLLYQPDFIKLGSKPAFDYQHMFSLSFTWKLRVR